MVTTCGDGVAVGQGAVSTGAGFVGRRNNQLELTLIISVMSAASIRRESFRMHTV
jgi:hypothetical protein